MCDFDSIIACQLEVELQGGCISASECQGISWKGRQCRKEMTRGAATAQADEEERDSIHATDHDAEDRRLAAAAAFTDGQRAALCGLRRRLLLNLGRLQRRREALTAQLQVDLETLQPPAVHCACWLCSAGLLACAGMAMEAARMSRCWCSTLSR